MAAKPEIATIQVKTRARVLVPAATTWQMAPSAEENAEVAFKSSRRRVSSSFAGLASKPFESDLPRMVTSGSSLPINMVERLGSFATVCKR
jgi:hypothetical protein